MPSAVKQRLQEYFLRHGDGVAAVYLFGSRATGRTSLLRF